MYSVIIFAFSFSLIIIKNSLDLFYITPFHL